MKRHPYLYSGSVILVLWGLVHLSGVKFVPSPLSTVVYILREWSVILEHVGMSLFRFLTAVLLTLVFGGGAGILLGRSEGLDRYVSPIFYKLYPIPKIAFLPLLILIFGIGNGSKIALVILIIFFQTALSIRDAVKGIPDALMTAMKSLHPTQLQIYRHLIIPAILPAFFTVLRLSIGTGLSVLFFSENYATRYGIGYYIMDSWLKMDYVGMFAGILVISLMGSVLFGLIDHLEKRLCPWNR